MPVTFKNHVFIQFRKKNFLNSVAKTKIYFLTSFIIWLLFLLRLEVLLVTNPNENVSTRHQNTRVP